MYPTKIQKKEKNQFIDCMIYSKILCWMLYLYNLAIFPYLIQKEGESQNDAAVV